MKKEEYHCDRCGSEPSVVDGVQLALGELTAPIGASVGRTSWGPRRRATPDYRIHLCRECWMGCLEWIGTDLDLPPRYEGDR